MAGEIVRRCWGRKRTRWSSVEGKGEDLKKKNTRKMKMPFLQK